MTTAEQAYQQAFKELNDDQKKAVLGISGPVLVIAGPGTGKTQLLSTRAAHIVHEAGVGPGNILCLTYTDAGANEMRARLAKIMGLAGAEVAVHTFHSFGTWIISQYPEKFRRERAMRPLDDLSRYHLLHDLLNELPFRHPLAVKGDLGEFARQGAVAEGIKAFKQAGYSPAELRKILRKNESEYKAFEPLLEEIFGTTLSIKRANAIEAAIKKHMDEVEAGSLSAILLNQMLAVMTQCREDGKTAALGDWRTKFTAIEQGKRVLKSAAKHAEVVALVDLYEKYQAKLEEMGRYDYEDMVLLAAGALETDHDICMDVAERFQYLMVDEYQDTNGAQNRLLDAILGANPIDSPNILVVGDDDQAIMRFQGAELSGMVGFVEKYHPEVIVLTENFRSGQEILDAAADVIAQTDERLHLTLPELGLNKVLTAKGKNRTLKLNRLCYASPSAQYAGVAKEIKKLLDKGVQGKEIAVICRRHRELMRAVPFLEAEHISVAYDKRENIMQDAHIARLIDLMRLLVELSSHKKYSETYLPGVLAAEYWGLKPQEIFKIALEARAAGKSWLQAMLASDNPAWRAIADWLMVAAEASKTHNFTQMFDIAIGRAPLANATMETSPYAAYLDSDPDESYVRLLSHLIRLREAVLAARPNASGLNDLIEVCDDYARSGLELIDDNPLLRGNVGSVQVMSAHGAKGREFLHVFIISAVDDIWGPSSRENNNRISLPENLPLYPAGDSDSDKLRLLFVSMTRAKSNLTITNYKQKDSGKPALDLAYLQLGEPAGWWKPATIEFDQDEAATALETAWNPTTVLDERSWQEIMRPLAATYRLSPSALRSFLDFRYSGPSKCIEQDVFKFPSAHNTSSALGSTVHNILKFVYEEYKAGRKVADKDILTLFDDMLDSYGLPPSAIEPVRAHGRDFLPKFLSQFIGSDFDKIVTVEEYLTAILPGSGTPVSGQLDAIEKTKDGLKIIDYKTGKPPLGGWQTKGESTGKIIQLHFYRQQLAFYKLLVENSAKYKGQKVAAVELVFVEPAVSENGNDQFIRLTIDDFDPLELDHTNRLIGAVHSAIVGGQLPDTTDYRPSLSGIIEFEDNLIQNATQIKSPAV